MIQNSKRKREIKRKKIENTNTPEKSKAISLI